MSPTRTRNTRATDPDSEGRMVQLVRSAGFQLVTPALLGFVVTVGSWYLSTVNAKLDALQIAVAGLHEDGRLIDARVKSLEDTRAVRNTEIANIRSDMADLKLQVGLLTRGATIYQKEKP